MPLRKLSKAFDRWSDENPNQFWSLVVGVSLVCYYGVAALLIYTMCEVVRMESERGKRAQPVASSRQDLRTTTEATHANPR